MPDPDFNEAAVADVVGATPPAPVTDPTPPAPPTPAVAPDFNEDAIRDTIGQADGFRKFALNSAITAAAKTSPDAHAKAMQTAATTGLPTDVVQRNPQDTSQLAIQAQINQQELLKHYPNLAGWLSNPDNASVSRDDIGTLKDIGDISRAFMGDQTHGILGPNAVFTPKGTVKVMSPDPKVAPQEFPNIQSYAAYLDASAKKEEADEIRRELSIQQLQRNFGIMGNFMAGFNQEFRSMPGRSVDPLRDIAEQREQQASLDQSPNMQSWHDISGLWNGAQRMAGGLAADAPLFLVGGEVAAPVGALWRASKLLRAISPVAQKLAGSWGLKVAQEGVGAATAMAPVNLKSAIETGKQNGVLSGVADFIASSAIVGATPSGVGKLLAGVGGPVRDAIAQSGAKAVGTSIVSEMGMQSSQQVGLVLAQALNDRYLGSGEPIDQNKLYLQMVQSGALGGIIGGLAHLHPAAAEAHEAAMVQSHGSLMTADRAMMAIGRLQASKLNQRAPLSMAEAMEAMGDGASPNVYIKSEDWQEHWLAQGMDPLAMAEKAGAGKAFTEAQVAGTDMAMPTRAYLQTAAESKGPHGLVAKSRWNQGQKTPEEAAEFYRASPDEVMGHFKQLGESLAQEQAEGSPESDAVHHDAMGQIMAAHPDYTPEQADRLASAIALVYGTNARIRGKSAMDVYRQEFPLQILGSSEAMASAHEVLDRMREHAEAGLAGRPADPASLAASMEAFKSHAEGVKPSADAAAPDLQADTEAAVRGTLQQPGIPIPEDAQKLHHATTLRGIWKEAHDGKLPDPGDPAWSQLIRESDRIDRERAAKGVDREAKTERIAKTTDTSHLQPATRAWLAALPADVRERLGPSIDYFKANPDPGGELRNLKMVADIPQRAKLNQPGKGPRGSMEFGGAAGNHLIMRLGPKADVSTVIHELMHGWTEVMGKLAQDPAEPQQIRDDYQKLLTFSGYGTHENKLAMMAESNTIKAKSRTEDWSDLSPEDRARVDALDAPHERIAEAFEEYWMEGKAPAEELRPLFDRIKGWMLGIYTKIRGLLNDDVRGVFDRMLVAGDAVDRAAEEQGMVPAITQELATKAGWGAEKFAAYAKRAAELSAQAKDKAQRDVLREYRKTLTKDYRDKRATIKEEARQDVAERPVYAAMSALQDSEGPKGEPLPEADRDGIAIPKWKLDKGELVARYGEGILTELPGPGHGRNPGKPVYALHDGLSLDRAAELTGYKTSDEMIRDLRDAPGRQSAIESETNARMAKLYPDAIRDGKLSEDAVDALHTKGRGAFEEDELKVLADLANAGKEATEKAGDLEKAAKTDTKEKKAAIAKPVPLKVVRAFARLTIGKRAVKDLNPTQYRLAEKIAHDSMMDSIANGDYAQAFAAKQRKILNGELYRAAKDAMDKTQAIRDYIAGMDKKSTRERIGKAGGWEWTVSMPDGTSKTFATQAEASIASRSAGGAPFERSSGYLEQMDALKEQYEFAQVSAGRLQRRATLRDWIAQRQAAGQPVAIPKSILDDTTQKNWKELPVEQLYDLNAALRNIEKMAKIKNDLLRKDAQGNFRANVDGAVEAIPATLANKRATENSRGLLGGLKDSISTIVNKLYRVHDLVRRLDGHESGGKFYNLWERPMDHAANHEQEMNAEDIKDLNGALDGWDKLGLVNNARLNAKEFIPEINEGLSKWTQLMVAFNWGNEGNRARLMEGHGWTAQQVHSILDRLDSSDKALVHAMWKLTSKRRAEVGALEERVHGESPEWVEATPFTTKEGTWGGGYAPIVYDYGRSLNPHDVENKPDFDLLAGRGGGYAMTSHGHTKERGEGIGLPLKLEFDTFTNGIAKVNRDLAWRETLMDANRIVRDGEFSKAVIGALGRPALDQFIAQLDAVAGNRRDTPVGFEKVLGYLRQGSNAAMRSFNVVGTAMQLAGLPFTIPRVGLGNWIHALGDLFSPTSWQYVHEHSTVMKYRNAERGKMLNESFKRTSSLAALHVFPDTAYLAMNKAWAVLDTHAWYGAYYKAMKQHGGDEALARDIADSSVSETQGATHVKDQAQALRGGGLAKVFTNNMSWASANFNLMVASVQRFADKGYTGAEAVHMASDMIAYMVVCPMVYLMARQALTGQNMDELHDGKKLAQHIGGEAIYTLLSSVPIGRDIAAGVQSGKRMDGLQGASGVASLGAAAAAVSHAIQDDKEHYHPGLSPIVKAFLQLSGPLLHFPSHQVLSSLEGYMDAERHGTSTLRGAILGKTPKE